MLLELKCIDNKLIRNILAIVLLIPVAADISLQLHACINFDSVFSYRIAISIIHSISNEAILILSLYLCECIINISNKAGYENYWFSRQGKDGAHNNVITGIAMNIKQYEWIDGGYDEYLLSFLQNALKAPGKKVIALHLYGSHEPSYVGFPVNRAVFHSGNEADDCYDHSVRYTDTLIGKMFSILENSRTSVQA
ncbi:TPA: sulfatase-like hydrolase/transferase [Enterobacter asburiae]|uniref:sulfatase-like hydrolase/transferase n=1 Tax=Enterobacter asburiae TaxID=61645 RepID=UPI002649A421|nr:sulfatase-like hydrolase/transferase [Enterobacter asburiae]WKE04802.1 sulfatase-like hydrolase/transferase [Enterobacter asburiae]WKE09351.1 sulfatase-like hydrolase/transferase [Enterobacter asburiae]